ncbi:hypothetical protein C2G38_2216157 [Gigaspora rosea]|uniref:Uncharacterized protein n=1 Tax=Gigaspora rosea TaxID=44941 RepID=A0A397U931_9GLOM|nr:hypothetical protein C2G38_2216157 [Gigaspora rosea]
MPKVDKWLAEFLTPPVLSLQRTEIADSLWYNAILVSKESIDVSLSQEKSDVDFYENLDDFPATNGLFCWHFAKVITISQIAAFHILMISRCWYSNEQYSKSDESLISQPSITYKNGSATSTSNFISDLTLIHPGSGISFNTLKILNNRRAYEVTNGLCKKAWLLDWTLVPPQWNHLISEIQDNESSESSDLDDNQENVAPFDVSTVKDPMGEHLGLGLEFGIYSKIAQGKLFVKG